MISLSAKSQKIFIGILFQVIPVYVHIGIYVIFTVQNKKICTYSDIMTTMQIILTFEYIQ